MNIPITELRVGNLVIDNETGEEYIIKPIDIYNASVSKEPLFSGCKLTEEKLVKFGFDKYNRPKWLNVLNGYCIVCGNNVLAKGIYNKPYIKFVHQLQNLLIDLKIHQ